MKMYASCPVCGHKLCKAENGSDMDIKCQCCGKIICVQVVANQVRAVPAERYTNEQETQKTVAGKPAQRSFL